MALAFFGALMIGLSLGLLGSGGSILTIPVLVYILERPEKLAVAEGLAIVGSVALFGAIPYACRKEVNWRSVLLFGLPGMAGACAGACFSYYISSMTQLILFASTMLAASALMLFGPASFEKLAPGNSSSLMTILKGFSVGCLTGLIGVGGGFIIVPALIVLCNLPMTLAVGTSLVIISMNSFTGFAQQLVELHFLDLHVNWHVIGFITAVAIAGSFAGSYFSKLVPQMRLRQVLGLSIFAMGVFILLAQL